MTKSADHADAVAAYATGLMGRKGGAWELCGCDTDGIDLRAGGRYVRVDFDKPVTDSKSCRETLVSLVATARAKR